MLPMLARDISLWSLSLSLSLSRRSVLDSLWFLQFLTRPLRFPHIFCRSVLEFSTVHPTRWRPGDPLHPQARIEGEMQLWRNGTIFQYRLRKMLK